MVANIRPKTRGATPIRSAGHAPDKNSKSINSQMNPNKNGPEGSSKSRIEPGDSIMCKVTLFCHWQLASIDLSSKAGVVTFIPYVQPNCMASPEMLEDPIY
jgi:hypothetical protein